MLADGEQAAGIESGVTPLAVFAFIEDFDGSIRDQLISVNVRFIARVQAVAIAPSESSFLPVEIPRLRSHINNLSLAS